MRIILACAAGGVDCAVGPGHLALARCLLLGSRARMSSGATPATQDHGSARIVSTPLGVVRGLDAPVSDVFIEAARRWPKRRFIESRSHPDESVTFATFLDQALRVATALTREGVRPGDRVVLIAENRPRWCVAHAGILLASVVVVAVDAAVATDTLVLILRDSGARHVVVSSGLAARVREAVGQLAEPVRLFSLDDDSGDDDTGEGAIPWSRLQAELADLPRPQGGDRPLGIVYTSGTTGLPKGCVLTHSNLRHELHGVPIAAQLTSDDVILQFLPLHHVLAQVGTYMAPASIGMGVVHATIHRAEDLTSAIVEGRVTVLLAVPQVFHLLHDRIVERLSSLRWPVGMMLSAALSACCAIRQRTGLNIGRVIFAPIRRALGPDLRLLASGGAALDVRAQRDFLGLGFAMIQAYGLTECSGGAVVDDRDAPRAGVVGRPMPGVEIRIDSPNIEGIGEVCLRGGLVTPGYHDRPEATKELLRDGWLMTGDLGRFDDDSRLVLVGRRKEVIVLGSGKNVNPEELEAHYARSQWIRELCVMAVPKGGGERGEKLHAVIVPDWDRFRREGMGNVREFIRYEVQTAALQVPAAQRVTSFSLRRDPLPRTTTRKLQRYLIDSKGDEGGRREAGPPDARLESGRGAAIVAILKSRAGADADVRADSHLELDLGLDSLERMEVALAVQSALGVRLTDEEIASASTVSALLDLVEGREPEGLSAPGTWAEALAEAGPDDLPPLIRHGRGIFATLALIVMSRIARLAFQMFFRLRVEGREHLPKSGPLIVAPNHSSYIDGFIMGSIFPTGMTRRGFALGEAVYVQHPVGAFFAGIAGVVPVDPARHLRQALRAGAAGLKQGMLLMLFPEGERSADGTLQEIRPGAPILSVGLGVAIIPALIQGSHEAWPRGQAWPRPRPITVKFGPPLDPTRIVPSGTPPTEAHVLMAEALRAALIELGAPTSDSR